MRQWHRERKWKQPIEGDLVYMIGSFGNRLGFPSLVISIFQGGNTARILCPKYGFEISHPWDDLEVVS